MGRRSVSSIHTTLVIATQALANSPTARLDAEVLLAQVLGIPRSAVLARGTDPLPPDARRAFERLVARRAAGEPVAYLTGRAWFYGLELVVTPDVLIPRPETEGLAEWAIGRPRTGRGRQAILDVGTGSGALALALAAHLAGPEINIHATEISAAAIRVARGNAARLGLADRITWHRADLVPVSIAVPPAFDLVVANLPYVATGELANVAPDVLLWEPHLALLAGPDGLALIRRLLAVLPARLNPGAAAAIEIGWRQGPAAIALARDAFPDAQVSLRQDLAGLDRLVIIET